jgi:hypothetical protein
MPLTLSDQDLAELNAFAMEHFRGKEISALQNWMATKQQQRAVRAATAAATSAAEVPKAAKPDAPPVATNGHAANPYAESAS